MEMKSRATLTAGLVRGTCGYQAGGLDTLGSCWLFPKPEAAVQAPTLQNCSPWLQASLDPPTPEQLPTMLSPPCPNGQSWWLKPWPETTNTSGQGSYIQLWGLACNGTPRVLPPHPSGACWCLTEPAPQADGSPAVVEVCLHDQPRAQQGDEKHHVPDHSCQVWERSQVRAAAAARGRHRSIPLVSWDLIRVSQGYQAQGDRQCLHGVGRQLTIPHPPNGF